MYSASPEQPAITPEYLIIGLIFAVVLMGIAANIIAKYIERYRWDRLCRAGRYYLGRGQDDL